MGADRSCSKTERISTGEHAVKIGPLPGEEVLWMRR